MKYKEIFVSWWFWVLVITYAWIYELSLHIGVSSIAEGLGFITGCILKTGIHVSIVWGIIWIIKRIYTKLKNK